MKILFFGGTNGWFIRFIIAKISYFFEWMTGFCWMVVSNTWLSTPRINHPFLRWIFPYQPTNQPAIGDPPWPWKPPLNNSKCSSLIWIKHLILHISHVTWGLWGKHGIKHVSFIAIITTHMFSGNTYDDNQKREFRNPFRNQLLNKNTWATESVRTIGLMIDIHSKNEQVQLGVVFIWVF